jgi:hypothetical protein
MNNLSPRQNRAIAALMTTPTIGQAAEAAQVSRAQLSRWMALPEFQAELERERRAMMKAATDALRQAAGEAVAALRRVLKDPETSPAVVVQAASAVLSHAYKAAEQADVVARLDALEAASDATR